MISLVRLKELADRPGDLADLMWLRKCVRNLLAHMAW